MFFGKPTIATGWSGNMEYMNDKVAFPIRYTLQPVKEGEYPQHEDQVWAEADVAHAAEVLIWLLDDPALRRKIGERGRIHMELQYSDKIVGASYAGVLRRSSMVPAARFETLIADAFRRDALSFRASLSAK
jgi:glycosyltransferase involved in cell wall biosynthesis